MRLWLAGLVVMAVMGGAVAQTNLAQVVTERREGLKAAGANMDAVAAVARSGGDPRSVVSNITAIETWFATFGTRFPAGTQMGAPGIDSKAQPAIWSDRATFDRTLTALQARLVALREAAASGDLANFRTAVQQTGAACVDCHRPNRAR